MAQLAAQVEAVVVGSAFVRLIERNIDNASLEIQLESFVRELKHGSSEPQYEPGRSARHAWTNSASGSTSVDRRIVELLNERTRVVEDIGRVKREAQLPIYEPKREDQVYDEYHGNLTRDRWTQEAVRAHFRAHHRRDAQIQRVRMEADKPRERT